MKAIIEDSLEIIGIARSATPHPHAQLRWLWKQEGEGRTLQGNHNTDDWLTNLYLLI